MPSPEERLRLLDPAQDPEHPDSAENYVVVPGTDLYAWFARTDAARAVLQEAVEVLADLDARDFGREVSPELALLLATELRRQTNGGGGLTPEDYLEAMKSDGLRVREASGG